VRRPGCQGPWKRPVFVTRCVRPWQSAPDFQGHGRVAGEPTHNYLIIIRLSCGRGSETPRLFLVGLRRFRLGRLFFVAGAARPGSCRPIIIVVVVETAGPGRSEALAVASVPTAFRGSAPALLFVVLGSRTRAPAPSLAAPSLAALIREGRSRRVSETVTGPSGPVGSRRSRWRTAAPHRRPHRPRRALAARVRDAC
jgi:hypothetical protein